MSPNIPSMIVNGKNNLPIVLPIVLIGFNIVAIGPSTALNKPPAPVKPVKKPFIGFTTPCNAILASSNNPIIPLNTPPPLPTLKKFLTGVMTPVLKLFTIPPNGPAFTNLANSSNLVAIGLPILLLIIP